MPVVPGGAVSVAVTTIGLRSNVVIRAAPKTMARTRAKISTGAIASVCGLRGFSMVRTSLGWAPPEYEPAHVRRVPISSVRVVRWMSEPAAEEEAWTGAVALT